MRFFDMVRRITRLCLGLSMCIGLAAARTPPAGELPFFDDTMPPDPLLPRAAPAEVGLDGARLATLVRLAGESDTSDLVIVKDGRTVVERHFSRGRSFLNLASITKSFAGLAVLSLMADGSIRSLDTPVSRWYPEWNEGPKSRVLLRHLLNHTSGRVDHESASLDDQADMLSFVRQRPLRYEPGDRFRYSNEGVQLLSGIIERSAGRPVDAYLEDKIFRPLGVGAVRWYRDPASNVCVAGGLRMHTRDVVHAGQMLLDRGVWQGRPVLPGEWVDRALQPLDPAHHQHGLLWWILHIHSRLEITATNIEVLRREGFAAADRLLPLVGHSYTGSQALVASLSTVLTPAEVAEFERLVESGAHVLTTHPGLRVGCAGFGAGGQHLVLLPRHRLLALRRRPLTGDSPESSLMTDFWRHVAGLVEH